MEITVRKPSDKEIKEAKTWPIWEKEASSFDWEYDEKETCLIISGKATVSGAAVSAIFGAGDYVTFPAGLKCTWKITEKIRKHYRFG
jgi:uncharacterized cupin superfamily protein